MEHVNEVACHGLRETGKFLFNWDSFHARLNSHYKAWSYKKKKHKKIRAHSKCLERTYS